MFGKFWVLRVCGCVRGVGVSVHVGRRVVVNLSLASVHISVCLCHCVNVVLFFPPGFRLISTSRHLSAIVAIVGPSQPCSGPT